MRHVNWRASARYEEKLFSNEFEQERVAEVGLILDARQRSNLSTAHSSLFDHSVTATATLAQALLSEGNRVSLLVYGSFLDWTYPGYGKIQRERIMQALARAHTGDSMVFDKLENLPTRVFPVSSQIILVSPLLVDDLAILLRMRAHGYQVMVINPDPIGFELLNFERDANTKYGVSLASMERKLLLRRVRHAGIHILSWDVAKPFDQAMQGLLRRLPAWYQIRGMRL